MIEWSYNFYGYIWLYMVIWLYDYLSPNGYWVGSYHLPDDLSKPGIGLG